MIVLRVLGGLFVALGSIGLFVPVWPTTIFWILAALCFARSSPAARDWIYARPGVGPIVEGFVEHGTLSPTAKRAAVFGLGLAAVSVAILLHRHMLWLVGTLTVLAFVTAYVLTRPQPPLPGLSEPGLGERSLDDKE
ncbi:MAG: YbaN family protein [Pseudomonadota bacterium]